MSNYRRYRIAGGTYCFTVVTHNRRALFQSELPRIILRESLQAVKIARPFEILATVLLPDHMHCIRQLPLGDHNDSLRWAQVKERFTRRFLAASGRDGYRSPSRCEHRERGIWQRRFWEHTVTDADDLKRCVDYIHWDPVKHGFVDRVRDWAFSSFHRFVQQGENELDWGRSNPCVGYEEPEWE